MPHSLDNLYLFCVIGLMSLFINLLSFIRCKHPKVEDCVCDDGYIRSNGACIARSACSGCIVNRKVIPKGATYFSQCILLVSVFLMSHRALVAYFLSYFKALRTDLMNVRKSALVLETARSSVKKTRAALAELNVEKMIVASSNAL